MRGGMALQPLWAEIDAAGVAFQSLWRRAPLWRRLGSLHHNMPPIRMRLPAGARCGVVPKRWERVIESDPSGVSGRERFRYAARRGAKELGRVGSGSASALPRNGIVEGGAEWDRSHRAGAIASMK